MAGSQVSSNPYGLSDQDFQDLAQIKSALKPGDPRAAKIDTLLSSRPSTAAAPAQPAEEKGSFLEGVYNTTIAPLVDLEKQGAQTALEHPELGPLELAGTMLGKIIKSGARAGYEQGKQAYQLGKQGRYSEAAGHGLAAALPFLGPAAAQAGEDIGAGKTSQGLGEAAGLIGSVVGPRVVGKTSRAIAEAIPSKTRAGGNFNAVMNAARNTPVNIGPAGDTALRAQELASRGGRQPKIVSDFLRRTTDPNKGPLTYEEGRDFASNAGELTAEERNALKPKVRRLVTKMSRQLDQANEAAADQVGVGDQYRRAMKEYRQAKTIEEFQDMLKMAAINGVKYAVPTAAGSVAAGYIAKKALGR